MKTIILILFISLASNIFPQKLSKTESELKDIAKGAFFNSSLLAYSVYDLSSGKNSGNLNSSLLLHPASNLKLITSAAALSLIPDYSFETSVFYYGSISDSILSGDVYIRGGFDPLFNTENLDTLISYIKKSGIKKIDGDIYGDNSAIDSLHWGAGWMWDDEPSDYFPHFSALMLNENCIKVVAEPSLNGEPAKINFIPDISFPAFFNQSATNEGKRSSLKIKRDWLNYSNAITLEGKIGINSKPDTLSVNVLFPEQMFMLATLKSLEKNGIEISGKQRLGTILPGAVLAGSFKTPLDSVIRIMNKESNNLAAEMVLRAICSYPGVTPAGAESGINELKKFIESTGYKSTDYLIADGSGVSHYNLVSTDMITNILKFLYRNKPWVYEKLINSLPVSGTDGTLKTRMATAPLKGRIIAKTGTLSGVSTLAGYIKTKSGKDFAFTIFIQHYSGKASNARRIQEDFCRIIYENN